MRDLKFEINIYALDNLLDKTRVNTLEGVKLPVITKVVVTKSYMVWESPRLATNPHIKRGYPGCT